MKGARRFAVSRPTQPVKVSTGAYDGTLAWPKKVWRLSDQHR